MNSKIIFGLVLAFVLSLALASAALTVSPSSLSFTEASSKTFVINNTEAYDVNVTLSTSSPFSLSSSFIQLVSGAASTVTVTAAEIDQLAFVKTGSVSISATNGTNNITSSPSSVSLRYEKSFCAEGNVGNSLEVSIEDINADFGDEEEWYLLDAVDVEVQVDNNNKTEDIDDVIIQFALLDKDGNDVTSDLILLNDDEDEITLGDIKDDDDASDIFNFIVPADFATGKYTLVVKAYSDDIGEDAECDSDVYSKEISIVSYDEDDDEDKLIAFTDTDDEKPISESTLEAFCGDTMRLDLLVWNVANTDLDDIMVTLKNSDLGINQEAEVGNIDEGESEEEVTFEFTIPANAREGKYNLALGAEFDDGYNKDINVILSLKGNCAPASSDTASVSATLTSDAVAGKEMKVDVRITNTGKAIATYAPTVSGYSSWASLESTTPQSVTLNAGESATVSLTFKVNKGVSGEQTFAVSVPGKTSASQISVNVANGSSSIFGSADQSWWVWVLVGVIVILIVLIIVVLVRIARA
jgi:uncharacterized membrane protein